MDTSFTKRAIAFVISAMSLVALRADAQRAPVEWRLTRESVISGDGSGLAPLNYVLLGSRGPDGTLVAWQRDAIHLVAFDSTGKFIATLGRSGRGPGEFNHIAAYGWRGDSVWVYDAMLRRLTILARDGRFLRDTTRASSAGTTDVVMAWLSNGGMLISEHDPTAIDRSTAAAGSPLPTSIRVDKPDGSRGPMIDLRAVTTGSYVTDPENGATAFVPWPWADNPLVSVSPNGTRIVVVETPHPTTPSGSFRVNRYSPTGERVSSTTHTFEATPVTQALRDSVDQMMLRFVGGQITEPMIKLAVQRDPKPQWLRAFDRMVVTNDGTIWLHGAGYGQRWFAIQTDDQLAAEIRLPARAQVLDGDGQSLWVSVLDGNNVPSIVRYRIDRR
jgi:hypothetical protein